MLNIIARVLSQKYYSSLRFPFFHTVIVYVPDSNTGCCSLGGSGTFVASIATVHVLISVTVIVLVTIWVKVDVDVATRREGEREREVI